MTLSRNLTFLDAATGPDEPPTEVVVTAGTAGVEGNRYILDVTVAGSTSFQIDTSTPEGQQAARELAELLTFGATQGNLHQNKVNARRRVTALPTVPQPEGYDFGIPKDAGR